MLDVFLWSVIFVAALAVLIKAADYFTESAEKIGIHLGMSPFIVGVTIVAFGTSLPELVSSVISVLSGSSEIVIGNVVGSNIANVFLVLGVAAILGRKIQVAHELIQVDLPLFIGAALYLGLSIWDGVFSLGEGVLGLILLIVYIAYTVDAGKKDKEIKKEMKSEFKHKKLHMKTVGILIVSAFFIYLGGKYTVDAVINLAEIFTVGKEIIALTAVALGTSLPELVVTIKAVKMKKAEIAIGNVLGSNIFNTFAVMGIPSLIGSLVIPASVLTFSLPLMLIASFLYLFMTQDKIITRWEGWLLVIFYAFFLGKTFGIV